jgi:hypothetical protein
MQALFGTQFFYTSYLWAKEMFFISKSQKTTTPPNSRQHLAQQGITTMTPLAVFLTSQFDIQKNKKA